MPAGAMPMPLSPNTTVTGPLTVAPSLGDTMYTSAPGAEGSRASETPAKASAEASRVEAMTAVGFMGSSPSWLGSVLGTQITATTGAGQPQPTMARNTSVSNTVKKAVKT